MNAKAVAMPNTSALVREITGATGGTVPCVDRYYTVNVIGMRPRIYSYSTQFYNTLTWLCMCRQQDG